MNGAERKFLILAMAGSLFAFELAQVAEVSELQPVWPIPAAPPCYRGVINFHGGIVAVLDLAEFMGLPACPNPQKLIVLERSVASLAFLVERVVRIAAGDQLEIRKVTDEAFASALIALPEGEARLLDVVAIVTQAAEGINR